VATLSAAVSAGPTQRAAAFVHRPVTSQKYVLLTQPPPSVYTPAAADAGLAVTSVTGQQRGASLGSVTSTDSASATVMRMMTPAASSSTAPAAAAKLVVVTVASPTDSLARASLDTTTLTSQPNN